jgi:hypothetical protein
VIPNTRICKEHPGLSDDGRDRSHSIGIGQGTESSTGSITTRNMDQPCAVQQASLETDVANDITCDHEQLIKSYKRIVWASRAPRVVLPIRPLLLLSRCPCQTQGAVMLKVRMKGAIPGSEKKNQACKQQHYLGSQSTWNPCATLAH